MSDSRPTLQRVLVVRIAAVFSLLVIIGTVVLSYVLDQQIHEQTDIMLAQVVQTEADGVLREYDEGLHVHDATVHMPALQGVPAEKYALIYDGECRVRASTHNVASETVADAICEETLRPGHTRTFDTTALTSDRDLRLRAVAYAVESPDDEVLVFVSAINHEIIDASVAQGRRAVVGGGILLIIAVVALVFFIARGITREVEGLSEAAETIEAQATELSRDRIQALFEVSERTPAEIAHLAGTLDSLVERLQRLLAVQNRFIAEAAHELRTPLTALQGELEVTLRRDRSSEEYRETLERALSDSKRLSALAESLLEAARTQSEDVMTEPLVLSSVVEEAMDRHRGKLEAHGIDVDINEVDAKTRVVADEMSLTRVLDNLLSNIAEHSNAASLRIWTTGAGGSTDFVELHVADDGSGLPDEIASSLFAPLSGSLGGGHGLGLYIAHKLMAKQSGRLEHVDDAEGTHWLMCLRRA
jgi:two-component system OmpR family sensor kinase